MPDAEDETMHIQLGYLAEQGRKATGANLAVFIIEFWDEKKGAEGNACVGAHKDGNGAKEAAESLYAVLCAAQTMLHSIDQELLIKDRKTGTVTEFKVMDPHSLLVDDPEEDG